MLAGDFGREQSRRIPTFYQYDDVSIGSMLPVVDYGEEYDSIGKGMAAGLLHIMEAAETDLYRAIDCFPYQVDVLQSYRRVSVRTYECSLFDLFFQQTHVHVGAGNSTFRPGYAVETFLKKKCTDKHEATKNLLLMRRDAYVRISPKIEDWKMMDHEQIFTRLMVYDRFEHTLEDVLTRAPKEQYFVDNMVAIDLFLQISRGLQVCHQNRVAHRDIRAENIFMVGGNGGFDAKRVMLGNFDHAKIMGRLPRRYRGCDFFDTKEVAKRRPVPLRNLPPEVLLECTDACPYKADIYMLALLMYRVLMGFHLVPVDVA